MSPKLTFELDGDGLPIRLDLFIRHEVPDLSRTEVQRLIRSGAAVVNGQIVESPSTRVDSSDVVEFQLPGTKPSSARTISKRFSRLLPQRIKFGVAYEDDHVVVVDKPAGMAVHTGAGRSDGTLVNALLARYPELAELEPVERPGIVHRLDMDTSGLMVVARTADAAASLSAAIRAHVVDRRYVALVVGKFLHVPGVIDRPIGRHPTIRTRQAVVSGGRPARTRFAFAAGYQAFGKTFSMVNLKLETGRTHQIRVHMQAIGYPILGDPVYGVTLQEVPLERQFLHAHRLSFTHPITGEDLTFESPLPRDLKTALNKIGQPSTATLSSSIV